MTAYATRLEVGGNPQLDALKSRLQISRFILPIREVVNAVQRHHTDDKGAIIAVPTAVTGWFGQNVAYPGFGNTAGLIASTIVITTLASTPYIAFRRWNWLQDPSTRADAGGTSRLR